MIYFDNAATSGHLPQSVITATSAALRAGVNAGRSGHALSLACAERVYAARKILQAFFGAPSAEKVVFTKNCTEALNIAILGTLGEGDSVVTTVAEHNSVLRPLEHLKGRGVRVRYAHLDKSGNLTSRAVASLVDRNTKAVIVTLASNVTGIAPDIAAVRRAIPKSCLLICDGAQACGHVPVNISELGIDALAVAGHKGLLGVQGSGALIMSERFNPSPIMYGGTGSESLNINMPAFYPDALEAGTLNYPAVISMGEGALYLKTCLYEHRDRLVYLTDMLLEGLSKMPFVKVYSGTNPYGIVAFEVCGKSSEAVADVLSRDYSVCVRAGYHCAPLMHAALGTSGLVRASLSAFNTENEVEYFLRALAQTAGQVG